MSSPAGAVVRIYLARHGETDWNRAGRFQGTVDVPLNRAGRAQAARLAASLAGVAFDAAYASPLARARDTATTVLAGRPVPLTLLDDLHELCYGGWQGLTPAQRAAADPALEGRWRADPWSVRFPDGESLDDVAARARRVLARLLDVPPARGPVLVCAHGHFNRVLLIEALGWPRASFWMLDQPNAGCTILDVAPGAGRLVSIAPGAPAGVPAGAA